MSSPTSATADRQWFAACPRGLENLLAAELQALGAHSVRETVAGVHFEGPLAVAYRACLWSRLANRVLLPLADCRVGDADDLYRELLALPWGDWFDADSSFAIDFSGESRSIRNTRFGAQRSKDAIVDWFRERIGRRPEVDTRNPELRFNLRLARGGLVVALDMSGGSLHRRGYRTRAGEAPLKENLAAALLLRADWPGIAARGGALIDPMCGSATLLLEGAMMVADIAPGLARQRFGFESWSGHNPVQWQALIADARGRAERGLAAQLPEIRGYDGDARVVGRARENIAAAGLEAVVRVAVKPLAELKRPTHRPLTHGLLICNPPYGERMGERESLRYLYRQLGEVMLREFPGWQAAVFTSDLELGRALGLRSHKRYALSNGPIPSHLLLLDLGHNRLSEPPARESAVPAEHPPLTDGAQMFANRLRKNQRRLKSWLKQSGVECYRLYDADMPEYAVAVDIYGDRVHVAEYKAPRGVDEQAAARRLEEVLAAVGSVLGMAREEIALKQRRRQRGSSQYQRQEERGEFLSVREGRARLLVNLHDYLDTGLFLDHRPLRLRLAREAPGKDFLNLFCYTGAATVHAALAGARSTTSVDLSNTYLRWLRKNLAHNALSEANNRLVRADCSNWLRQEATQYDLVLLDPPSFSNSSAMDGTFDVQRDQEELVKATMQRVRAGGTLYFSNNLRGFQLAPGLTETFACVDITAETLDPDFQGGRRIHQCWQIRHRA